jgi:hypothetical protein
MDPGTLMDKSSEEILGKIFLALGGIAAGFFAAFRRLGRTVPTNGRGLAMLSIEADVGRVLKQMRKDMDFTFQENQEEFSKIYRRIRHQDEEIEKIKIRLDNLEQH